MRLKLSFHIWIPLAAILLSACTLGGGGTGDGGDDGGDDISILPVTMTSPPLVQPQPTSQLALPTQALPSTSVPDSEPLPTSVVAPTQAAVLTPVSPGGTGSHQVVRGQWIYQIARIYGISPEQIIAANPGVTSNPDLIFPDQQLVIPSGGSTVSLTPVGTPTPVPTPVPLPTTGPASLPTLGSAVFQALLDESLTSINSASCSTPLAAEFLAAWNQSQVGPRLRCPIAAGTAINGTWLEFGPGSRIIWLKELGEFHAVSGAGFGQRWVFEDNSGLAAAAPQLAPAVPGGYTPEDGRFGWLLDTNPEISSVFTPAIGNENAFSGQYQRFANGAMLFDGTLTFIFFDDSGPWWYLSES